MWQISSVTLWPVSTNYCCQIAFNCIAPTNSRVTERFGRQINEFSEVVWRSRSSPCGRSFHSRGPAAEKLLSPSLLCVRVTSSFRWLIDWLVSWLVDWVVQHRPVAENLTSLRTPRCAASTRIQLWRGRERHQGTVARNKKDSILIGRQRWRYRDRRESLRSLCKTIGTRF